MAKAKKKKKPFETMHLADLRTNYFRLGRLIQEMKDTLGSGEDYPKAKRDALERYADKVAKTTGDLAFHVGEWLCELRGIPTRSSS